MLPAQRYYTIPRSLLLFDTLAFRVNGTILMPLAGSHLSRGLSHVAPTRLLEQRRSMNPQAPCPRPPRAEKRLPVPRACCCLLQGEKSVRPCTPPAEARCLGVMNTDASPLITDTCPDPQDLSTCYAQFGINGCGRKYYAGRLSAFPSLLNMPIHFTLHDDRSLLTCVLCPQVFCAVLAPSDISKWARPANHVMQSCSASCNARQRWRFSLSLVL